MKALLPTLPIAVAALLLPAVETRALTYYFEVPLDGAQEVLGGDPDGSGLAKLWLDSSDNSIRWDMSASDIVFPLTGAHIHRAPAGVNGPVVINFSASLAGTTIDPDVALVIADPVGYYVNLHNSVYPSGAIRGQLGQPQHVPEAMGLASITLALGGLLAIGRRRLEASNQNVGAL